MRQVERARERVVTVTAEQGVKVPIEPIERWIGRRSPVGDTPLVDAERFAWVSELEAHWTEIRDEVERVLEDRDAIPPFRRSPSTRSTCPTTTAG